MLKGQSSSTKTSEVWYFHLCLLTTTTLFFSSFTVSEQLHSPTMSSPRKQASSSYVDRKAKGKQRQEHDDKHDNESRRQDPTELAHVRDMLIIIFPNLVLPMSTTVDPRPQWPIWVDLSSVSSSCAQSSEPPRRPTFLTPVIGRFDWGVPDGYDSDESEFVAHIPSFLLLGTKHCQRFSSFCR